MEKWLGLLLITVALLYNCHAEAKTIKVAVIDTGIRQEYRYKAPLCPDGHISFAKDYSPFMDTIGHGTNIVGLIAKEAGVVDYCIVVIKFYDRDVNTMTNMIRSLHYANQIRADIINISAGGLEPNAQEAEIIKTLLENGVQIVAAAGNEGNKHLGDKCNYYPACYDSRIWVVSAKDVDLANDGSIVDAYRKGLNCTAYGITMSGTSQATAKFTGHLIKNLYMEKQ